MRYQRSKTIICLLAMGAVSLPLQADETLPDSSAMGAVNMGGLSCSRRPGALDPKHSRYCRWSCTASMPTADRMSWSAAST